MNNNDLLYELYYKMIDIDNSLLDVIEDFNGLNKSCILFVNGFLGITPNFIYPFSSL